MNKPKNFKVNDKFRDDPKYSKFIGSFIGKLKIIDFPGLIGNAVAIQVKCDCGLERITLSSPVLRGRTKCNCSNSAYYEDPTESSWKELYRKLLWNQEKSPKRRVYITQEEHKQLASSNCSYCGLEPSQPFRQQDGRAGIVYTGLDRIDSNLPYIIDNIAPCCKYCNFAKNDSTVEEFRNQTRRRFEHMFRGELIYEYEV